MENIQKYQFAGILNPTRKLITRAANKGIDLFWKQIANRVKNLSRRLVRPYVISREINLAAKNKPIIEEFKPYIITKNNSPSSKQKRLVPQSTFYLYPGPRHSINEVVNPDGTVNVRNAMRIQHEVADNIPGAFRMESRLENPKWHKNDPNTFLHTKNVAQSAWSLPIPIGYTKQDQIIAALGHDFGKIISGDGHAENGAGLLYQIFPDITTQQLTAIGQHMGLPTTALGRTTKMADFMNGKSVGRSNLTQTQGNPLNDIIDLARQGNVEAIQQLKRYGLEPGNPGVYRFISQEEADNILKGGRYAGRFNDGRVDVTANPNGTTAANSSFRITFKPEFDLYKPSQRLRMKNVQLQDGWIMDGYELDDVATIERRLPNGNYEPYKGQITITPQNAASMTPELWTAAQDAAITKGNMTEALRLRDLHFKIKSLTKILDEDGNVLPSFHYSENKFTEFNPDKIGVNDPGFYGKGFYSSPNKNYASTYGENEYKLYINSKEPFKTNNNGDRSLSAFSFNRTDESPLIDIDNLNLRKELENADAVWQKGVAPIRDDKPIEEIVVTKPTQMKLADAVTYDNEVRIPLGERDNFNIKDIRYGLIPFVGLTGLTLKNK